MFACDSNDLVGDLGGDPPGEGESLSLLLYLSLSWERTDSRVDCILIFVGLELLTP